MKVLITGAAGFIGSHLVDSFLELGNEVIGIDDLSTGSTANLEHLARNSNFEFVHHDVTEEFAFDADFILNFACPASPIHYQKTPIKTLRTSFLGTLNSLELARKLNIPFIQASTSEVYGDPEVSPQSENYLGAVNPIGPRACYDEGKRAAETAIFDYIREFSLDARVVRIFNTYGPRMSPNDGRVVSNFLVAALKNEPITIYGNGLQTRSFCYVSDTVDAIIKLSQLETKPSTPINIGNPNEMTMLQLAESVIGRTNSKSEIVFLPLPQDDPKQRCPDISLANDLLAWKPQVSFADGITKTLDYFKGAISL